MTYVVDANIVIDMQCGRIIYQLFQLPYTFISTDIIIEQEIIYPESELLINMGLKSFSLTSEQNKNISTIINSNPGLSIYDISAYLLSNDMNVALLTGDYSLRRFAKKQGIEVHGTLWLLDRMVEHKILLPIEATDALNTMLHQRTRLPQNEVDKRIDKWKENLNSQDC